ncbi:MAG: hypothetical protein ACU0BB_11820 [Paracoccaceae bacterium]
MSEETLQFQNRLRRLERKHTAMANGYTAKLRKDGLIVMSPSRAKSRISGQPVILFLLAFFLFKGFLIASIGNVGYDERVAKLQNGNVVEVGGAWVMQSDAMSELIAEKIRPFFR